MKDAFLERSIKRLFHSESHIEHAHQLRLCTLIIVVQSCTLIFGGLKLLHTKNMVKGLSLIDKLERFCEICIFGKQHRETFPFGKSYRVRTPLEIVHSDICGCKYFLTFIDGYSGKIWVYFLKHKYDAFSCFQQFKALVENQSGHRIKILRTDRGDEYVSNAFLNFYKTHGI